MRRPQTGEAVTILSRSWLPRDLHLPLVAFSKGGEIARVMQRVACGGHHIHTDTIIRRYSAGVRNMRDEFLPLADVAFIYDNSGNSPLLIAEKRSHLPFVVRDHARWRLIEGMA